MLNRKKYRFIDFLIIPIKIIPIQTIFSIVYTMLNALMPAYQTLVIANFINIAMDIFSGKRKSSSIVLPIILILCYVMFTTLMPSIVNIINLTGKNKLNIVFKDEIISKRASLEYMHVENTDTQELINRVCSDPVGNFISGFNNILAASNLIISSISLLVIVMSSTIMSGIIIVAVSIPLFIIAMKTGKKNYEMGKEAKEVQRKYNYLSSVLSDREFAHERTLFKYSKKLQKSFNELYKKSYNIESKIEWKSYINMKSGSLITLIIVAIIVAILIPSLHDGKISIGVFVALVNAIFSLIQSMSWQLSETMSEHSRLKEYLKDFTNFVILSEKKDACVSKDNVEDFKLDTIEFKNVNFKYPGTENYILKNCSFILSPHKSYAFVGINGAGKSTIIKLLIGQYDNFEGEILINKKSIKEYDYAIIKGLISVVFQDYARYSITFKDNIIIGDNMNADDNKIKKIISVMELKNLLNDLADGIDTPLGKIKENGIDISGGQWQRIAISRLLYSRSKINILDEPTASLDPIAESKVYEIFSKLNSDRFTIYITHRLGAAKIADEILVLSDGHIVEQGSHRQLMQQQDGLYYKMFESQKSWYKIPHADSVRG